MSGIRSDGFREILGLETECADNAAIWMDALQRLKSRGLKGAVLYTPPLMKKLKFGEVRRDKTALLKWLELHNLIGISTLGWVLVVGITGVVASLADVAVQSWRNEELTQMTPSFVAFPSTTFSSPRHYTFFMRGTTTSSFMWQPVLIYVQTAELTETRELPWHLKLILWSKPLHFGDYGGLPLKMLWATLDVLAIVVLGSGLYLWAVSISKCNNI